MKILSSYPGGLASVAELTRDLKILACSGSDWVNKTKLMASAVIELDMFGAGFVERYSFGWRLTAKGLAALEAMESSASRRWAPTAPREASDPTVADHDPAMADRPAPSEKGPALARRSRFAVIEGGRTNTSAKALPIVAARARS